MWALKNKEKISFYGAILTRSGSDLIKYSSLVSFSKL